MGWRDSRKEGLKCRWLVDKEGSGDERLEDTSPGVYESCFVGAGQGVACARSCLLLCCACADARLEPMASAISKMVAGMARPVNLLRLC